MKRLIPEADDFDPYGKDVCPLGSGGKEPTYRLENGTLVRLTDEEYEAKQARRPRKKPKTNRRGNRFL